MPRPVAAPPSLGPDPGRVRDDQQVPSLERRLEDLLDTVQAFVSFRFNVRAPVSPAGDIVDAIAGGVNFLGEELEASFNEIERRVADRTDELAIATQELSRRVLHDELTDLPNRALFWEHLSHRLATVGRRQTGFAVLFIDVDDFKRVNDTQGHAAGDRLLVDMASRLRGALRAGDTTARLGGDEFVVLLDDVASEAAALVVAERLGEMLRVPQGVGTDALIATVSIGVAVGPDGMGSADDAVAAADAAMYDAKRRGGAQCVLYRADLHGRRPRPPDEPVG